MRQIFRTHDHILSKLFSFILTPLKRGGRKLELVIFGGFKSVVGLGLRDLLNEPLEVTATSAELEAVQAFKWRTSVIVTVLLRKLESWETMTGIYKVINKILYHVNNDQTNWKCES
jgi:hypothetical protein